MAVFTTTMFSNSLHRLTELTAIVPVEKAAGIPEELRCQDEAPMKTIMLLHGYSGTHTDWIRGSRIEQLAMKYHVAVLCPSGENGFYVDDRKRDAMYEQFLCEVIDFGRRVFPLSDKREDTYIGGFSMGGYGALVNGMKHPSCSAASWPCPLRPLRTTWPRWTTTRTTPWLPLPTMSTFSASPKRSPAATAICSTLPRPC